VRQLRRHLVGKQRILDYGCGAGQLLEELLRRGYPAAGSDATQASVDAVARRLADRPGFLGAFTRDDLLASNLRFDAVFVVEVVEHLYDPALDELLETLRKLTLPGATLIFTTPNEENLEESWVLCPCCARPFHRWQHVRSWSAATLGAHLEQRGLRVVHAFTTDFYLSFAKRGKRIETARKKLKYWRKPHKHRPHLAVVCQRD
jgi:2-polyprenyl-3-methyl-5-hydroxy-6-metoxy-1,4-benzoquinol methylase